MPEIAEVARIVHYLKRSLVGKTLAVVKAQEDNNVFGKVGTSAAEVEKALVGKTVVDAGQQGKYFWLVMSSPPHPVMHFGMTGWVQLRGEPTAFYRPKEEQDPSNWPPKFWKFRVETEEEPKIEAAFTDARRFGRVRLLHCDAKDIRNTTPLKENGPDPVIDADVITEEWLAKKMKNRHVPIKALLLDQAMISGIGNWVGDEILYNARLHPEQYSDTFSDAQIKQLHTSIHYVCQTAIEALGDADKFPEDWLFKHRWGKGKKDAPKKLPNGAAITHITVGGRTSCVVQSLQKKTGAVAGDLKREAIEEVEEAEQKPSKRKKSVKKEESDEEEDIKPAPKAKAASKSKSGTAGDGPPVVNGKAKARGAVKKEVKTEKASDISGRRRSTRVSGQGR